MFNVNHTYRMIYDSKYWVNENSRKLQNKSVYHIEITKLDGVISLRIYEKDRWGFTRYLGPIQGIKEIINKCKELIKDENEILTIQKKLYEVI